MITLGTYFAFRLGAVLLKRLAARQPAVSEQRLCRA